jgi:hypothetical protein
LQDGISVDALAVQPRRRSKSVVHEEIWSHSALEAGGRIFNIDEVIPEEAVSSTVLCANAGAPWPSKHMQRLKVVCFTKASSLKRWASAAGSTYALGDLGSGLSLFLVRARANRELDITPVGLRCDSLEQIWMTRCNSLIASITSRGERKLVVASDDDEHLRATNVFDGPWHIHLVLMRGGMLCQLDQKLAVLEFQSTKQMVMVDEEPNSDGAQVTSAIGTATGGFIVECRVGGKPHVVLRHYAPRTAADHTRHWQLDSEHAVEDSWGVPPDGQLAINDDDLLVRSAAGRLEAYRVMPGEFIELGRKCELRSAAGGIPYIAPSGTVVVYNQEAVHCFRLNQLNGLSLLGQPILVRGWLNWHQLIHLRERLIAPTGGNRICILDV